MMRRCAWWLLMAGLASLAGCAEAPPQALGTLEYERIAIPAPASERIASIAVREGEQVEAGTVLLTFEDARIAARTRAVEAQAARQASALQELEAGPRGEQIERARAQVVAARARSREAAAHLARLEPLGARQLVAADDVDRARAAAVDAAAGVRAADAALAELQRGTRPEQIAQGEAALRAARAESVAQQATLDDLAVRAPRAGRIDSLPLEAGARPAIGTPVAVLLVGDAPHARVYVPQPIRMRVQVGDPVRIVLVGADGDDRVFDGRVRMIRDEPSFTPYYALVGDDAARLVYLAEIALPGDAARGLPAGLPVRAEFGDATAGGQAQE